MNRHIIRIQHQVAEQFGITVAELVGSERHRTLVRARHIAMALVRDRCRSSYPEIGRAFGNRDHTTAMSAVRRVREVLRGSLEDQELRHQYLRCSGSMVTAALARELGLRVRVSP